MEGYTGILLYVNEDDFWHYIDMVEKIAEQMIEKDTLQIEYHGMPQLPEQMIDILWKGKEIFKAYVKGRLSEINDECDG